ncbi:MAG: metallophosphoesterase [Victivallales bacterium]|nr:metallophosphoesterase [Victivallales bacterium]
MSTVFLGMDFAKEKFTHRAAQWRRVSSYGQRHVLRSGELVDLVKYEIPARLPANKGKKILWFSDLHFDKKLKIEEKILTESLEFIKSIKPDYVVFGGDTTRYSSYLPIVRDFLKSFPEDSKKLAVLGNWEYSKRWLKCKGWRNFFESSGFKLLVNEPYESNDFFFYGIDDLRKGTALGPKEVADDKEVIFLAHSPDAFIHISNQEILKKSSLVLSGHTHGGQIRLPFFGALLTSSRYWRHFDYGHFANSYKGNMIVSSGLGCSSIQLRIACRRELVLIDFV